MSSAVPNRIVRAFQRIMGVRGGDTLRPDGSILQVIVLDDHSRAGYPGGLAWHVGLTRAPVAAQQASIAVSNEDQPGQRSIVTVDFIRYRTGAASDVTLNIGAGSGLTFPATAFAALADQGEKSGAGNLLVPSVGIQAFNSAIVAGRDAVPSQDTLPHDIPGIFSLGPGQVVQLVTTQLNTQLWAYFQGRYYEPA